VSAGGRYALCVYTKPGIARQSEAILNSLISTLDSSHISHELFDRLRRFYSEGEVVELMASIGLFNYFNRFNNALRIEPTRPGEGAG
jgi:hypothetical protein